MYAVIKTGGKQYRVKAGDVLVVEKLAGEPGAKVSFDQVLMLGDGAGVTVGAPTVAGAVVSATLVETRKGEKIKVFKKIRRQGYRRTGGHRQLESVLRVTAISGDGKSESWDGEVDLTPRAVLNLRARGLDRAVAAVAEEAPVAEAKPARARAKAQPEVEAEVVAPEPDAIAEPLPVDGAAAPETAEAAPAPKKRAAPKAKAESADAAEGDAKPAKKPAARKAKPAEGEDA
jgi:large subunit ribosomal protein L21